VAPGAAQERTRLAWLRTLLAVGAAAMLTLAMVVRRGLTGPVAALALAAVFASAGAIMVVALGRLWRQPRGETAVARRDGADARTIATVGVLVAALTLAALYLVVVTVPP
jgi:hypothetical protein